MQLHRSLQMLLLLLLLLEQRFRRKNVRHGQVGSNGFRGNAQRCQKIAVVPTGQVTLQ
jgi:hypothetical protein